jgi:hypothetical protein
VPVAGQSPHAAHEHDDESGDAHPEVLGNDSAEQQPDTQHESSYGLNGPALVVHTGVTGPHRVDKLWILAVKRLLNLLELTLFMLRERHDASHETLPAGSRVR